MKKEWKLETWHNGEKLLALYINGQCQDYISLNTVRVASLIKNTVDETQTFACLTGFLPYTNQTAED